MAARNAEIGFDEILERKWDKVLFSNRIYFWRALNYFLSYHSFLNNLKIPLTSEEAELFLNEDIQVYLMLINEATTKC
jgi:hypothetical protein